MVWNLALASRKSSSIIYQSLHGSILRESHNAIIRGRQVHAIQTICSNLTGFRATIQIQVDREDKQNKQNAMKIYTDMQNT